MIGFAEELHKKQKTGGDQIWRWTTCDTLRNTGLSG